MLKALTPVRAQGQPNSPAKTQLCFLLLLCLQEPHCEDKGCNRKCNRDSSQHELRPNGASEAEAKGGANRPRLLQGQPVPQAIPHHLSSEQTLSWFWSADLEHLRGILLELALVSILTFYSIMQACCAKPSWIPWYNRNSGMEKKPQFFQKEPELIYVFLSHQC